MFWSRLRSHAISGLGIVLASHFWSLSHWPFVGCLKPYTFIIVLSLLNPLNLKLLIVPCVFCCDFTTYSHGNFTLNDY